MAELEADYGIVKIDGREATSVGYARRMENGRASYDLTFRMGKDLVQRVKGLDADEMLHAVGEDNARAIHQNPAEKATLSGKGLTAHEGLSPEAQEAAISADVDKELQERATQGPGLSPERAAFSERMAGRSAAEAASVGEEGREPSRTDQLRYQLHQMAPGLTADDVAARREAVKAALSKQFITRDNQFFFRDRGNALAFEDRGGKIVTAEKDSRVASAMAQMAEAKGWSTVKVSGTHDFKRQLWLEASARGLKVQGYTPKDADLAALQQMREARTVGSVERGTEQVAAKDGPKKTAAERTDSPSKEQIAAVTKQKQRSEDYNQLRPDGVPREPIGKAVVIDRVAGAIAELKIKNPETRQKVQDEVRKRLDRMSNDGKVPTLHTYDRNAPSRAREIDKARPAVERNVERTR